MKIGVMLEFKHDTDIYEELAKVRNLELSCCQLCCWDIKLYTQENANKIISASKSTGIEITALWAGWSGPKEWNFYDGPITLGLVPETYRFVRLQELYAASDFAQKIGVSDIITHVGFIPENPYDPNFHGVVSVLKDLTGYMKKKNQRFLFETGQETPVTMLRTIEEIGMDNLGINFDTANLILYGKASSVDALDIFGKYVCNTHLKDGEYPTTGRLLGNEKALGQGRANIPMVIKKLKDLNYDGPWIIEREISGAEQTADIIMARDMIKNILNNY